MIDEELKKSSEEQGTEETTAGKATEQEASTTEEVKETETKDSDAKDAGETENAEQSVTSEASDAETEKLKKKYEDALAEQKDKYIRLYAEFDNYRKRTEKEKAQNFDFGAREVIEKLLPVVDNFERALGTVDPEDEDDAFTKGVRGIYKQLEKMFEDLEVKAIPAEGEKFDPNLHNAVMHIEDDSLGESSIVEVFQKGYQKDGKIIRYAMVKVAN